MILSKLNFQDSDKYFLVVLLYLNKLLSSVLTESNCTVGNKLLNDLNIVYLLNLFLCTVFFAVSSYTFLVLKSLRVVPTLRVAVMCL